MKYVRTQILSHRGWSARFPENTVLAFEQALHLGIEGLEFDVQLSKDGVPVVIHDPTVDRTTNGSGPVSHYTVAQLQELNAAVHHSGTGFQPIPTLDEVLAKVLQLQPNAHCNIELKVYEGDGHALVDTVIPYIHRHPLANRILFSSFHHGCLDYLRSRSRTAKIGLLYELPPTDPWILAKEIDACSVNLGYKIASEPLMSACRAHGLSICLWTVDDPLAMRTFYQSGIDVLITNNPDKAIQVRTEV